MPGWDSLDGRAADNSRLLQLAAEPLGRLSPEMHSHLYIEQGSWPVFKQVHDTV
jgi:hypothetical protein